MVNRSHSQPPTILQTQNDGTDDDALGGHRILFFLNLKLECVELHDTGGSIYNGAKQPVFDAMINGDDPDDL
ncbi:hypothetical protein PtA15_4A777 [Puccinia triticina]|uniref:Uncharacterized protein n=1 Tax=Puccinia triticina TaxID=208348 RepID=A0ABY7CI21_9BASI|nr:uncharacterized protein PtA15_4A777 [Puccinia triticina]WAQ84324.1 hypothetical protein PtA15_4A777 [Puccinia triticina]